MKKLATKSEIKAFDKFLNRLPKKNKAELQAQIRAVEVETENFFADVSKNMHEKVTFREKISDIAEHIYDKDYDNFFAELKKNSAEIAEYRNRPPYVTLAILATLFTCNLTMLFYVLIFIRHIF